MPLSIETELPLHGIATRERVAKVVGGRGFQAPPTLSRCFTNSAGATRR